MTKELNIHEFQMLDDMNLEDVCDILEQSTAKHSIDCRNWKNEYPYHPVTIFAIARSRKYIYVDFFVRGNFLRAINYTNNSPVSEDSCVEFFLQVPGQKEYWNFEFNCIGTVNASHRETREHPIRLTDEQINLIKVYPSCGTRPFEEMEGLFAWNLTIAIPFSLIGLDADNLPDYIMGNFYKCGSKTGLPHYLSWSPIKSEKPNFHCPESFGKLYFR